MNNGAECEEFLFRNVSEQLNASDDLFNGDFKEALKQKIRSKCIDTKLVAYAIFKQIVGLGLLFNRIFPHIKGKVER